MHNLYTMWLYAFEFITGKVRVDAFSLLYSKLLHAKLCLFVFGATFAASHWRLKISDYWSQIKQLHMFVDERAGRETQNLEVASSNPIRSDFFLIRCLFILHISLCNPAFLSCSRGVASPL